MSTTLSGASDPTLSTNPSGVGIKYKNTTDGEMFICTDATAGENVWTNVGAGTDDVAPNYNYGGRMVWGGGHSNGAHKNVIDYVAIATLGNATDFGDLTRTTQNHGSMAGGGRVLFAGGDVNGAYQNTIDYITVAALGNATDFGDLLAGTGAIGGGGTSDASRGIIFGGYVGGIGLINVIQYVTIAALGNATDFGDLLATQDSIGSCCDGSRAVAAAYSASVSDMQYVTVATAGNATAFGSLTEQQKNAHGSANDTRGLIFGGASPAGTASDFMVYITIQTLGNATDFGNLTVSRRYTAGGCNGYRVVMGNGGMPNSPTNVIDYVTIATPGNATDFGDTTVGRAGSAGDAQD
jgi:hypothetical protein